LPLPGKKKKNVARSALKPLICSGERSVILIQRNLGQPAVVLCVRTGHPENSADIPGIRWDLALAIPLGLMRIEVAMQVISTWLYTIDSRRADAGAAVSLIIRSG
jgi:hypothetical protein